MPDTLARAGTKPPPEAAPGPGADAAHTAVRRLDVGVYGARGIPSTYSGFETFLTVLLPELTRRGHAVTMYCRAGEVPGSHPYAGVRRVLLPAVSTKQLATPTHGALAAVVARWRRHDVVLAVNVANAPYCLLGRLTGQPVVLNPDGQEWLRGKWGAFARAYWRGCARLASRSAAALVADCEAMARIYRDEFTAPSTVIPYCWTELEKSTGDGVLSRLGVEPGRYALVAGRLVPENNTDRVAEAYARSGVDWPLLVLGAANYRSPVARALSDLARRHPAVCLVGHVGDRADYARLVGDAGAYLHAHSVGGINPSLVEAMGCGGRIIALDTAFNREALGGAGTYFADFVDGLPRLLREVVREDAAASAARRQAAARRARSRYSLAAVADAYERLLVEVAMRPAWRSVALPTPWST